jgi:hypothetical protein
MVVVVVVVVVEQRMRMERVDQNHKLPLKGLSRRLLVWL